MTMHGETAESMIDAIETAAHSLVCVATDPELTMDSQDELRSLQEAYNAMRQAMRDYYRDFC